MERPFPAYRGDRPFAFICYSHEDAEIVYPELVWLKDQGFQIWYDEGISPGSEWSDELAKAIKNASALLFFGTPNSASSENCVDEISFALNNKTPVLSIYLRETSMPDGMQMRLDRHQAIMGHELSKIEYREKLLRGVSKHLRSYLDQPIIQPALVKRNITVPTIASVVAIVVLAIGLFLYNQQDVQPTIDVRKSDQSPLTSTKDKVDLVAMRSIAVLPFVNMSDDASNEYFSEGLSEELLNLLVRIPELKVAARTSSFSYKGKDTKIAQIGEELGVAHVLQGSVRKSGNHVRITAQLIKADDGFHLWSQTYDRTLDDIFVTQDEIAAAVVDALKVTLLGAMPEQRVTDHEVYALYLQGRHFTNLKSKDNLEKAQSVLEQALAIDPDYAPAWVAINMVYGQQSIYGFRSREQAFTLSMAAVEKALAVDSNSAEAWASLAYLKRGRSDWAGAKAAIEKALELEPNSSWVIGAAATLAGTFGQLDKSIELFERNVKLDPLSLSNLRALALRYGSAGRQDKALETFNRILAFNPDLPGILTAIAMTSLLQGDAGAALIGVNKNPSWHLSAFHKAKIYSTLGKEAEAKTLIKQLLEGPADLYPLQMADVYAWRGENDLAFKWFEKAHLQGSVSFNLFLIAPWHRSLVGDPRYALFVEKIGLLEDWKAMPPEYGGPPVD